MKNNLLRSGSFTSHLTPEYELGGENPGALETLYHTLSAAFCVIVVISNIISAKMVALPYFDFSIPAGVIIYPLTFLLSDLVTEIFGPKKAKRIVYTAFGMSLLSFSIIQFALVLEADSLETQAAFQTILGPSALRIFSSLIAYSIAQIMDIQLYALIKRWTGPRFLWLRNNVATCISQMIDTFVVDMIFLYWGLGIEMKQVTHIMLFSYMYKAFFSFASTPFFYLSVYIIQRKYVEMKRLFQQVRKISLKPNR